MSQSTVAFETQVTVGGRALRAVATAEIGVSGKARIVKLATEVACSVVKGDVMTRISLADYTRLCTEAAAAWDNVWNMQTATQSTRWV